MRGWASASCLPSLLCEGLYLQCVMVKEASEPPLSRPPELLLPQTQTIAILLFAHHGQVVDSIAEDTIHFGCKI